MTMELVRRSEILPAKQDWQTLNEMAKALFESGLLPRTITNPYAALAIIEKGRELGIPPMLALSNINMIEGKPSADAQLIAGLIYRDHGDEAIDFIESTAERATVRYKRRGWSEYREYTYTIEEARTALLLDKANWKKMPRAMLRARAITNVAHMAFQDTTGGLYSGEEMGADVTVSEDGAERPRIVEGEFTEAPTPATPELCDADHYNKAWHAAVKGTRFAEDDVRHKFIAYYTGNDFDSLTAFLTQATTDQAARLIRDIERRIDAEAKKAAESRPIPLSAKLEAAVTQARTLGANVDMPEHIDQMSDADVQAMLDNVSQAIEMASKLVPAEAVPA